MYSDRGYTCLLLVFSVFILLQSPLRSQEKPIPVSYDLKVTIEPTARTIAVRGSIEVPIENASGREVHFSLHETFAIKRLSVDGRRASLSFQAMSPTPIYPARRDVLIRLPTNDSKNLIRVDLEYEGRLKELPEFGVSPDQRLALDDQINSRLVELASYSSWYPQFLPTGHPIAVDLEVSLPKGWIAICSGKKLEEQVKDSRAITRWASSNDSDILIAASPNYRLKSTRTSDAAVEIYYAQVPEEFVAKEMRQIAEVMKLFSTYLGQTSIPGNTIKHVYSPKRKGQGRAGIARPGMIVTSEGRTLEALASDPSFSLFQDVAHEIAHFWWNFGSGQGDWINEAFAEYFSAIAVEQLLSEQAFETVVENYRKAVRSLPADSPSLSMVPFDGSGFVIRYYKGSLLLDSMRRILGDENFFLAARQFFETYKGKSIGTAEFRTFWVQKLGGQKDLMNAWIDSRGGLPEFQEKQNSAVGR
jgi:hypothetical protein